MAKTGEKAAKLKDRLRNITQAELGGLHAAEPERREPAELSDEEPTELAAKSLKIEPFPQRP
ncbi:MAG: hypothetical protein IPM37_07585 [Hahellaceae bacterium]|nr:hypothetical protein [Hahellaceae bacterium]